jgi:hypothetical protein
LCNANKIVINCKSGIETIFDLLSNLQDISLINSHIFKFIPMNKICVIFISILLSGLSPVFSQNIPTYPIPSFNVTVNAYANFANSLFQSNAGFDNREKQQVNIRLRSPVIGDPYCHATVWIYSLDHTTVLGPYNVSCGEVLSVEVEGREWGVFVDSDCELIADVWYD